MHQCLRQCILFLPHSFCKGLQREYLKAGAYYKSNSGLTIMESPDFVTISNSLVTLCRYIRLSKHGKRFELLKWLPLGGLLSTKET